MHLDADLLYTADLYPPGLQHSGVEVQEVNFNPEFTTRLLLELDFTALRHYSFCRLPLALCSGSSLATDIITSAS